MSTHGSNLDCTILLRRPWEELVPWERTPWHWSKHVKFRPSWIMTVSQRLSFSTQLSNCNLATCWHIDLSIVALLHLSISIHLSNSLSRSMKFFGFKIALGLALGESWPLLTQPQKNTDVYKDLISGKAFPSTPAEITFGENKDVNSWIKFRLDNYSFCPSLVRSLCRGNEHHGIDPNMLTSGHQESWLFHKGCVSLHSSQTAILPHVGTLNSA